MDIIPVKENDYAGKHPSVYGKNSNEQWKRDFHKSVFGAQSIVAHPVPFKESQVQNGSTDDRTAGVTQMNLQTTKYVNMVSEIAQK